MILYLDRSLKHSAFLDDCNHLPVSDCPFILGESIPHWSVTRGFPALTWMNNLRICLLVGCDGLEADASRFRFRSHFGAPVNYAICKLCMLEAEDVSRFLIRCPVLDSLRRSVILSIPQRHARDMRRPGCRFRELSSFAEQRYAHCIGPRSINCEQLPVPSQDSMECILRPRL